MKTSETELSVEFLLARRGFKSVEDLLARRGFKYSRVDGPDFVDLDIWSSLSDDPVDTDALLLAGAVLASLADEAGGDEHQKPVAAVHLSIRVATA